MNTKALLSVRFLAITGVTAALYAVLTVVSTPLSYGLIQCRISEIMNLLVFYNPIFAPGLIIGCFLSNVFSPAGAIDIIVGTIGTVISVMLIARCKRRITASLCPAIGNIIVGVMLAFVLPLPEGMTFIIFLLYAIGSVMLGELVAVTLLGNLIFMQLTKNQGFMKLVKGFRE